MDEEKFNIISTLSPFTETEGGVVTMFSHADTSPPHERKQGCFAIRIVLNFAFRHYSATKPPLDHAWQTEYATPQISCRAFTESAERVQRSFLGRTIIGELDLPFDIEKQRLSWAFEPSLDGETADSILDRLVRVARDVCLPENAGNKDMKVYIEKVVTDVTLEDYAMLILDLDPIVRGRDHLLSDWFAENMRDLVDLNEGSSRCARQALFKLAREDASLSRLRSVKVTKEENVGEEEGGANNRCAICFKDLMHGEIGIGLPCSHLFHGFCILVWIDQSASCPVCRYELKRFD